MPASPHVTQSPPREFQMWHHAHSPGDFKCKMKARKGDNGWGVNFSPPPPPWWTVLRCSSQDIPTTQVPVVSFTWYPNSGPVCFHTLVSVLPLSDPYQCFPGLAFPTSSFCLKLFSLWETKLRTHFIGKVSYQHFSLRENNKSTTVPNGSCAFLNTVFLKSSMTCVSSGFFSAAIGFGWMKCHTW